ncbi:MAG TPA: hypothetical protein VF796_29645 [Humisphaera sp.]
MGSRLKKKAVRAARRPKAEVPIDLPPWRNDWLYAAVFREVDQVWNECLPLRDNSGRGRPVLVLEFEGSADDTVGRRVGRAWLRDERGLIELDADQRSLLLAHLWDGSDEGQVQRVTFHVAPDRRRVVWGWHFAPRIGQGTTMLVEGRGADARLVADPAAGFWVS